MPTYVDDIVTGADSEDLAYRLYAEAKEILRHGGFNLRKFHTNSPQLQQKIDRAEESCINAATETEQPSPSYLHETYAESTLGSVQKADSGEHKIIGVRWEPSSDQLAFNVANIAQLARMLEPTKSSVVSMIGRFHDPIGFLAPDIIRFKALFQKLCEDKVEWDQMLPEELLKVWKSLIGELQEGQPIPIPRSYLDGICQEVE